MKVTDIHTLLPSEPLLKVDALPFPRVGSGKVREIYAIGDDRLLIIATDRLSAFDVVLPDGIPGKGIILTQMSLFWFARATELIATHLVPDHPAALAELLKDHPHLVPRSMLVKRLQPVPVEAVVRGYLAGSGY